jgi:hypothetical protein
MSREVHVQFCERAGVRLPCATHLVIACRPGQAREVLERTTRWLKAKGLKLNESKTRLVDIRQTGINFLGFNLTWRQSLKHRRYLHVEPSQKSR